MLYLLQIVLYNQFEVTDYGYEINNTSNYKYIAITIIIDNFLKTTISLILDNFSKTTISLNTK